MSFVKFSNLILHLLMFPSFYDFFLEFSLFSFALSWLNLYWVRRQALMFILQFRDARPSWKGGACFQWRDTSKVVRSTKSHLESDGHWIIRFFVNVNVRCSLIWKKLMRQSKTKFCENSGQQTIGSFKSRPKSVEKNDSLLRYCCVGTRW